MNEMTMTSTCPNCNENVDFRSKGGWLNYANGLGSPKASCPHCYQQIPTGRRHWNDLSAGEKLLVWAKMLIWFPVGTAIGFVVIFLLMTTRNTRTGRSAPLTNEEAVNFISTDLWFFILMSFVISLAGNLTTLRQVIKSSTKKKSRW